MQDNCLLAQFSRETEAHVRRESCSIPRLLELIGPDHIKHEFWSALEYRLNRDIQSFRDPITNMLRLTFNPKHVPDNKSEWYIHESWAPRQMSCFYIQPIPLRVIAKLLRKPRKATEHTLKTVTERLRVAFPELRLFSDDEVLAQIVAPALFWSRQKNVITD